MVGGGWVVQLITLSTPTRVEVELGCGWAVTTGEEKKNTTPSFLCMFRFIYVFSMKKNLLLNFVSMRGKVRG